MRVHHLNCGTMCPVGFALMKVQPAPHAMICHVLVVETRDGLVVVDTGLGRGDLAEPSRLGGPFVAVVKPKLAPEETLVYQLSRLGFSVDDVRHIVPTHLDLDHAGGLGDFPKAKVHVYRPELEAALHPPSLREKHRYVAAQWAHGADFVPYDVAGERWFGFESVRGIDGLPPEILLIPTIGHTRGHVAVAVDDGAGFLVHAGDAYFHRDEMDPERPRCPAALRAFQRVVAIDDVARVRNRERLRMAARDHALRIFCAHDPVELERERAR